VRPKPAAYNPNRDVWLARMQGIKTVKPKAKMPPRVWGWNPHLKPERGLAKQMTFYIMRFMRGTDTAFFAVSVLCIIGFALCILACFC